MLLSENSSNPLTIWEVFQMKLFNKLLCLLTKRWIIPYLLEDNLKLTLVSLPRVTKGGYYVPAVMKRNNVSTIYWNMPMSCNVILNHEGYDIICWHGIGVIRVED